MTSFFLPAGPIWIKFRRMVQNDTSIAVIWSKSKTDVEFQHGGRLGEFNGMSSHSHLPHCRVLPLGKFTVVMPESHATLQGAVTWRIQCYDSRALCHIAGCCHRRIQWHVIPEPPATLQGAATWQIQCHDSRATCHIAGCFHRENSVACHPRATCRIAGCCHLVKSLS